MIDSDIKFWENTAKEWDEFISLGDVFRKNLLDGAVLDLSGDVSKKHILDAGCGQGYFSKILRDLGAEVIGIDGSEKLINIAKSKNKENKSLEFIRHNLKNDLPFDDCKFDTILCNMVLMDLEPIDGVIKEFSRVLKSNGELIFSILHPMFTSSKINKTFLEKILFKAPHCKINTYKTPAKKIWQLNFSPQKTVVYHRPIEYYTKQLSKNSFLIKDIQEPTFDREFADRENNFIKLCAEIPLFLIIKAIVVKK